MKTKIVLVALLICVLVAGCVKKTDENTTPETNDDKKVTEETVSLPESLPEQPEEIQNESFGERDDVPEDEQQEPVSAEPEHVSPPKPQNHVSVTGISLTTYDVTVYIGQKTMPIVTMTPHNASDKGEIWESSDTSVATVDKLGNIRGVEEGKCVVTVRSTDNPDVSATVKVTVVKSPECTYVDGILVANKTYPLPESYAPGWDEEASSQLHVMFAAAKKDGISLFVKSGYRSYVDQRIIYNGYVARDGKEAADRYSARPGHSEHQTGLAFDLNSTENSFANTPEAAWIAANSYKYGFIVRYPKDKEHITGYIYEPWHVRYLGIEKATEVYESGLCLEEFLGIDSVYSY